MPPARASVCVPDAFQDIASHDVKDHILERNTTLGLQQSIFFSIP
jgi:hypothetical protein